MIAGSARFLCTSSDRQRVETYPSLEFGSCQCAAAEHDAKKPALGPGAEQRAARSLAFKKPKSHRWRAHRSLTSWPDALSARRRAPFFGPPSKYGPSSNHKEANPIKKIAVHVIRTLSPFFANGAVALTFISAPISIGTANAQQSATEREALRDRSRRVPLFFSFAIRFGTRSSAFFTAGSTLSRSKFLPGSAKLANQEWVIGNGLCFHKIGSILALLMVGFACRTQTA
jgi:hypothetical protein